MREKKTKFQLNLKLFNELQTSVCTLENGASRFDKPIFVFCSFIIAEYVSEISLTSSGFKLEQLCLSGLWFILLKSFFCLVEKFFLSCWTYKRIFIRVSVQFSSSNFDLKPSYLIDTDTIVL